MANKWSHIGIQLDVPVGTLDAIMTTYNRDPQACLVEMLKIWLKKEDPPASWSAIVDALFFLREEQLARELSQKYMH